MRQFGLYPLCALRGVTGADPSTRGPGWTNRWWRSCGASRRLRSYVRQQEPLKASKWEMRPKMTPLTANGPVRLPADDWGRRRSLDAERSVEVSRAQSRGLPSAGVCGVPRRAGPAARDQVGNELGSWEGRTDRMERDSGFMGGVWCAVAPRRSIPNRDVKRRSADGTGRFPAGSVGPCPPGHSIILPRRGAGAARRAHNPKVGGSNPPAATR